MSGQVATCKRVAVFFRVYPPSFRSLVPMPVGARYADSPSGLASWSEPLPARSGTNGMGQLKRGARQEKFDESRAATRGVRPHCATRICALVCIF
jgi:hypothetical protein